MEKNSNEYLNKVTQTDYKYGFETLLENDMVPKGLSEDIIRLISAKKKEPQWMLDFRLKAYGIWLNMSMPTWAHLNIPPIDFQDII